MNAPAAVGQFLPEQVTTMTLPVISRSRFAEMIGIEEGVVQGWIAKGYSRPMVRVRSGAQARFSVGQDVPVLGQATLDKNGNPVQAVEYKQSGVILTVTPDIRESVVDLDISQELSSFVATTTGVNGSPTLLKRTVNSKLSIKPGEVVIFAGLNEKKTDETESRFFGFSLGNKINQGDSEILVFVEAQRI